MLARLAWLNEHTFQYHHGCGYPDFTARASEKDPPTSQEQQSSAQAPPAYYAVRIALPTEEVARLKDMWRVIQLKPLPRD
jgi:hypothetical protein